MIFEKEKCILIILINAYLCAGVDNVHDGHTSLLSPGPAAFILAPAPRPRSKQTRTSVLILGLHLYNTRASTSSDAQY